MSERTVKVKVTQGDDDEQRINTDRKRKTRSRSPSHDPKKHKLDEEEEAVVVVENNNNDDDDDKSEVKYNVDRIRIKNRVVISNDVVSHDTDNGLVMGSGYYPVVFARPINLLVWFEYGMQRGDKGGLGTFTPTRNQERCKFGATKFAGGDYNSESERPVQRYMGFRHIQDAADLHEFMSVELRLSYAKPIRWMEIDTSKHTKGVALDWKRITQAFCSARHHDAYKIHSSDGSDGFFRDVMFHLVLDFDVSAAIVDKLEDRFEQRIPRTLMPEIPYTTSSISYSKTLADRGV